MSIENIDLLKTLITDYQNNSDKYGFFIGAGMSMPLFPSWKTLLLKMIESAGNIPDKDELVEYISKGENYLDIAEECVNIIGEARYRDFLEKLFDFEFTKEQVPEAYNELISLNAKTIITTNYDRIPEIAGQGMYRIFSNRLSAEAMRSITEGKKIIFKLHGDITDHGSIVLRSSDYSKIIHSSPSSNNLLQSLLSTKIFIFLGFSLSDPHINLILDLLKSINANIPLAHYILLEESSTFKIHAIQNRYGLNVIPYTNSDGKHIDVLNFIKALNTSVDHVKVIEPTLDINNINDYLNYLDSYFTENIPGSSISLFCIEESINISIIPTSDTKSELQKEILSIFRLFTQKCDLLKTVTLHIYSSTGQSVNVDENQSLVLIVKCDYPTINRYAQKNISSSTVWSSLLFYSPPSITNLYQESTQFAFPLNLSLAE